MSHQLPLETDSPAPREQAWIDPRTGALRRRRAEAVRMRRRRLMLADLAAGALLAIVGIIVAPGLAILALAAALTLAGCGVWVLTERYRARRSRRARRRSQRGRAR